MNLHRTERKKAILLTCIAGSKAWMGTDVQELVKAAARQFADIKLYCAGCGPMEEQQALEQAWADGVQVLAVQPLYLLYGLSYDRLLDMLHTCRGRFEAIAVGKPLLACDTDLKAVAKALLEKTAAYDDGETAVCFIGHGTKAAANHVYADIQERFRLFGYKNHYIGVLHAQPSLDTIKKALRDGGCYNNVVLVPFMVRVGRHARQDLAGGQSESWKSILEREGYQVSCILEGLVQMPQIQKIYLEHLRACLENFTDFAAGAKS